MTTLPSESRAEGTALAFQERHTYIVACDRDIAQAEPFADKPVEEGI
jgi:hypothetical protein